MIRYDYSKLFGRMREKHISQRFLAERIGINTATLNAKINNKRDFTQSEIRKICEELEIDDVAGYFFAH